MFVSSFSRFSSVVFLKARIEREARFLNFNLPITKRKKINREEILRTIKIYRLSNNAN